MVCVRVREYPFIYRILLVEPTLGNLFGTKNLGVAVCAPLLGSVLRAAPGRWPCRPGPAPSTPPDLHAGLCLGVLSVGQASHWAGWPGVPAAESAARSSGCLCLCRQSCWAWQTSLLHACTNIDLGLLWAAALCFASCCAFKCICIWLSPTSTIPSLLDDVYFQIIHNYISHTA